MTYLNHLLAEISNIEVRKGMDKCIWSISQDGNFTVGSLRCLINDHMLPSLDSKTTWDKSLPRKVFSSEDDIDLAREIEL
nr:hypothetical protein [Tanacetum cinerariifolium]